MPIKAFSPAHIAGDEAHMWYITLEADERTVEHAILDLTDEERGRADQFRFETLRTSYILSHAVLRRLLAVHCDRSPSRLAIAYGPQGKPFLAHDPGDLRFNMSHSGGVAAYALARGCEVGVDVEQHRHLVDMLDIAERFFAPQETQELMAIPQSERESAFFRCWVRKEAFIKARGGGLSIPLDSFQAWPIVIESLAVASSAIVDCAPSSLMIEDFTPATGYSGAVAFDHKPGRLHLHGLQCAHNLLEIT
jgi:4'-phosphopantetheinyl transferase